jgi:hypothetical protein
MEKCECGSPLPPKPARGPRRKRCDDCQARYEKERRAKYYEPLSAAEKEARRKARMEATGTRTEKRCPGCDTVKPVAEFYPNKANADGRSSRCADCERVVQRERLSRRPEGYEAANRAARRDSCGWVSPIDWSDQIKDRFWSLVGDADSNGCRPWNGETGKGCYGGFRTLDHRYTAHRVSFELHYKVRLPPAERFEGGAYRAAVEIDHNCRHAWCVSPWHLGLLTPEVNAARIGGADSYELDELQRRILEAVPGPAILA